MTDNTMTCDLFNDRLMAYLEHETDDATRAAMERHAVRCADCGPLLADVRKLRVDAANLPELVPARDLWAGIAERIEAPVVSIGATSAARGASGRRRRWMQHSLIAASLLAAAGLGYVARGGAPGRPVPVEDVAGAPLADTPAAVMAESDPPTEPAAEPAAPASAPRQVASAPRTSSARAASTAAAPAPEPATGIPPRPLDVQLAVATLTADYDREIARLRALIEQRRNQLDPVTVAIIEKNLAVIDTAIAESRKAVATDPASRFLIEALNQSLQNKVELMRTVAMLPSST